MPPAVVGSRAIWLRVDWPEAGLEIRADAASQVQSSCLICVSFLWCPHPENRSMSAPSHRASATHCWSGYPGLCGHFDELNVASVHPDMYVTAAVGDMSRLASYDPFLAHPLPPSPSFLGSGWTARSLLSHSSPI